MFFYDNGYLKISKYEKVICVDDEEIKIMLKNNRIINVKGSKLLISFFDKLEIIIVGNISRLEILDNDSSL